MNGVVEISWMRLGLTYVFVLLLLVVAKKRGIGREREIILSTVRMTVQLIAAGYILIWIFERPHPVVTLAAVGTMEIFAVGNIFRRVRHPLSYPLRRAVAFSMVSGTLSALFFFLLVVVGITPWFEPRYFIPIAGMIIGNSMTGISLGVNRLLEGVRERKEMIEGALMLGAYPKRAMKEVVDASFDAAILPTLNSMMGMGIVFLPGMMTGQILSGVSPLAAIEYQIAIMLGIAGSVALSVILFVHLGTGAFFNQRAQLVFKHEEVFGQK